MGTVAPVDDPRVEVALARIEGKLDLLGASLNAVTAELLDHELRLRAQEARPATEQGVLARLRDLEQRATVSPKQLAGWLTLGLMTVGTAAPFILFSLR